MKRLLLLLIPLVLVVGCSGSSDLEARLARLEAENASLKEVKQSVFSLKVGDCYNGRFVAVGDVVDEGEVELVSCDEPHTNEVYTVFELPDSSWKGQDYVSEQGLIGCKARFEAFVGIEYDLSIWYSDATFPSEQSWKEMDDREVQCSVSEESGIKVSGSAKGSRR